MDWKLLNSMCVMVPVNDVVTPNSYHIALKLGCDNINTLLAH